MQPERSDTPAPRMPGRLLAARAALALGVFGSTMALGATHTTPLLLAILPLAAAAWLTWWTAEPIRPRRAATILFWTGLLLTLWTLLQALPMPIAWLRAIDPQAADVWSRALLPLGGAGPAWATISLDPGATRVEVVRGIAYLLVFVSAVRLATRREGALFLDATLVVTALALAIAAWVHPALGADKVFGIYRPLRDPGARHIAPILNSNVLSGYLNIGLTVVFGHALRPRSPLPRSIAAALTVFLVATQLWVASRGGTLGMVAGLSFVVWMSYAPGPGERSRFSMLLPGAVVAAGLAMMVLSSSEQAWQELSQTDVSKLQVALRAFHLVPLFPVFGVGRGAFESAFPVVRADAGYIVYTHPENILAQWATEWGPAVSLLAGAAMVFALRPRSALLRSTRAAGAWAALACVGLQNLVDFSSEYPGVVLSLTVCAALVVGGSGGVAPRKVADVWAQSPRALCLAVAASAAAALALGLTARGGDLRDDRLALRAAALDPGVSREAFHAEVRASMLRHPAEPYLPFTGGLRALRARDESVVPWIERALERAPVYGPAHLVLARALSSRSPAQSRLEYRLTVEQAPEMGGYIADEILRHVGGYDDATELAAQGPGRARSIDQIAQGVAARLPATAARLDVDLAGLSPASPSLALRRAEEVLQDLRDGVAAPWCADARARCAAEARALADEVERLAPDRCEGYSLHARVALADGDTRAAIKELRGAAAKVVDRTACLQALAEVAYEGRSDAVLDETLDQLARAGCSDPKDCEATLLWVANFELGRGNPHRALAVLQRAHERDPGDDALLGRVADLAASVGLHAEALRAYEELARHHPDQGRYGAAAAAERDALLRESVKL